MNVGKTNWLSWIEMYEPLIQKMSAEYLYLNPYHKLVEDLPAHIDYQIGMYKVPKADK